MNGPSFYSQALNQNSTEDIETVWRWICVLYDDLRHSFIFFSLFLFLVTTLILPFLLPYTHIPLVFNLNSSCIHLNTFHKHLKKANTNI